MSESKDNSKESKQQYAKDSEQSSESKNCIEDASSKLDVKRDEEAIDNSGVKSLLMDLEARLKVGERLLGRKEGLVTELNEKIGQLCMREAEVLVIQEELKELEGSNNVPCESDLSNLRREIAILRQQQQEQHLPRSPSSDSSINFAADELECPVCLEEMRPPRRIFSCSTNAHLFCERCKDPAKLKMCSQCRDDLILRPPKRNRLAERWACRIFQ